MAYPTFPVQRFLKATYRIDFFVYLVSGNQNFVYFWERFRQIYKIIYKTFSKIIISYNKNCKRTSQVFKNYALRALDYTKLFKTVIFKIIDTEFCIFEKPYNKTLSRCQQTE